MSSLKSAVNQVMNELSQYGSYEQTIDSENTEAVRKSENTPGIYFKSSVDESILVFLDEEQLKKYVSEHSQYRSSYFYEKLSDRGRLIYRAIEFAMENSYDTILIKESLCTEEIQLESIALFLAMDSPLVEQNLRYSIYQYNTVFPLSEEKPEITVPFKGYCLSIENFTKELFDKKLLAIEKAKEIITTIPEGASDIEKAEFLYRYIVNNVEYSVYDGEGDVFPYLHDALILNKTHCDGSSNAYSLLLNMSGIKCFEKYANSDIEGEDGHTWNCAQIDGKWYNFEATTTPNSLAGTDGIGGGCYFAFADNLLDYTPEFKELMPVIDSGYFINSSGHFSSEQDQGVLDAFTCAIKESGNKYAVFTFDTFSYDSCEATIQKLVDSLYISVRTVTFEGKTRTILYIEVTE
ncbi:MAG: hypothetical protein IJF69_05515 [Clostridia bacterium]|nr:hypothetical protein [Clostridia bacterium]